MNVHLLVGAHMNLDFLPRYVVPTCIVLGLFYVACVLITDHFAIKREERVKMMQQEEQVVEYENKVMVIEEGWKYPSFFSCHVYDSSRLRIDTDVIHALVGDDLRRLTDDERWFVEWYYAERKKGMTHFSTFGSLGLPDAPQAEVCKELRAMLTAPTLEDKDIF